MGCPCTSPRNRGSVNSRARSATWLTATRALLGPTSAEYVSLMLRTAPVLGVSVRQRCRERVGWFRSRSQLYWWSNKGAVRVADALNRGGIAVSPELQTGPRP